MLWVKAQKSRPLIYIFGKLWYATYEVNKNEEKNRISLCFCYALRIP